jgi:hypothetical protein
MTLNLRRKIEALSQRSVNGCCASRIPHSAFAIPHFRAGISLLEVLISMFILTVGLLSISSLLPVGSFQVQKAGIEDRKSTIGQNAFREFRTRGMSDVRKWTHYFSAQGPQPVVVNGIVDSELAPYVPLSVAIDPLCLGNGNTGGAISKLFPRLPAGVTTDDPTRPRMPRVGLTDARMRQLAELIFVARDDTVFEKSTDPDSPPISKWELDPNTNNPIRRQYEGNFSWLVTLTPAYFNATAPGPMTQYNVSIAIFFKRNINAIATTEGVEVERMVDVSQKPPHLAGFGLGGGELVLTGTVANTAVQPGNWVLVSGRYQIGNITRPVFRWYRVVAVSEYESEKAERWITLAGPDWPGVTDQVNAGNWRCKPSSVGIFEGCVGVFEKTVHLEGPSVWSN